MFSTALNREIFKKRKKNGPQFFRQFEKNNKKMGQNACREEQGEIMFFRKKEKKKIFMK